MSIERKISEEIIRFKKQSLENLCKVQQEHMGHYSTGYEKGRLDLCNELLNIINKNDNAI